MIMIVSRERERERDRLWSIHDPERLKQSVPQTRRTWTWEKIRGRRALKSWWDPVDYKREREKERRESKQDRPYWENYTSRGHATSTISDGRVSLSLRAFAFISLITPWRKSPGALFCIKQIKLVSRSYTFAFLQLVSKPKRSYNTIILFRGE